MIIPLPFEDAGLSRGNPFFAEEILRELVDVFEFDPAVERENVGGVTGTS